VTTCAPTILVFPLPSCVANTYKPAEDGCGKPRILSIVLLLTYDPDSVPLKRGSFPCLRLLSPSSFSASEATTGPGCCPPALLGARPTPNHANTLAIGPRAAGSKAIPFSSFRICISLPTISADVILFCSSSSSSPALVPPRATALGGGGKKLFLRGMACAQARKRNYY
jgi:hypothetical protein